MLLLSGALVSGPYALITTAVSADLVSDCSSQRRASGQMLAVRVTSSVRDNDGLC